MTLGLVGSIGVGLVWGWLLGHWNGRGTHRRPRLDALLSLAASLSLVLLAVHYSGWMAAPYLLAPATVSLATHLAWLSVLDKKTKSGSSRA